MVRRLVAEGLCERPRSPDYIEGMIVELLDRQRFGSIREALLDDPGLLDDEIWEIFEIEARPGNLDILNLHPAQHLKWRWECALVTLAEEGRIPRARLLDASLGGLERDFHEVRAKWFIGMHEALEPTIDEQAERAGRYLSLLASRNASTVTFSLKTLAALERAGRIDPRSLIEGLEPALVARTKGTVVAALDLLRRAADRDAGVRPRAAVAAVHALLHDSAPVQGKALDLIERHGDRADPALTAVLRDRIDAVAASQRARIADWLGTSGGEAATVEPESEVDSLLERARALDPELAKRTGVAAARAVLERGGGDVPAATFSEMDAPRLDPDRAIVPVEELEELVVLFAKVVENPGEPDDLERVLDGVSRLCDRRPPDFDVRTGPVLARMRGIATLSMIVPSLCELAHRWIAGEDDPYRWGKVDMVGLSVRRVRAIAQRAGAAQAAPLLGAPTHRGGWIDPRALVDRARFWAASPYPMDPLDASLALLRLAPDPEARADALRSSTGIEGPYAEALRYALGGEAEDIGPDVRLWVAAARARAPREDDPRVEARHPNLGPDAGRAGHCRLRPAPHPQRRDQWMVPTNRLIEHEPPVPPTHAHDLPTVFLNDVGAYHPRWSLDDGRWVATIWPLGSETFFAAGAEWLLGIDLQPRDFLRFRPFVEPLLDPDVPIGPMGRLVLASALSSGRPELQGLGVDALIAAIDDGRIDGRNLGAALQRLVADGLAKGPRIAKALREAARVSPLHAGVTARALQIALIVPDPSTRDLNVLLELLKELLIEIGERISDREVEAFLRSLKVSDKTAKLIQDILGLEPPPGSAKRAAAVARALSGRLDRAERWRRIKNRDRGRLNHE
jgi:hypothetical protein